MGIAGAQNCRGDSVTGKTAELTTHPLTALAKRFTTPLYTNALYILFGTGISAVSGFLFWLLASKSAGAAAIGLAQGALGSATLLAALCDLGMATALLYHAVRREQPTPLVNATIAAGWLASIIGVIVFIVGIPLWASGLTLMLQDPLLLIFFGVYASANAVLGFQDAAMLILRRGDYVFWRNLACNVPPLLLALVLAMFGATYQTLFIAYTLPNVIVCVFVGLRVLPAHFSGYQFFGRWDWSALALMMRYGLTNYVGNLLWSLPTLLIPLIAVNVLPRETTGHFFINWTFMNLALMVPRSVASSMFVEGARRGSQRVQIALRSLGMIFLLILPVIIVLWLFDHQIIGIFGRDYINSTALRLLLISAIPFSISTIFMMNLRVSKRLAGILIYAVVVTVSVLGAIALAMQSVRSIEGLAMGWLVGWLISSGVAVLTTVIQYLWTRR
jgi:O-antigen/teichoic acid export membrane protein